MPIYPGPKSRGGPDTPLLGPKSALIQYWYLGVTMVNIMHTCMICYEYLRVMMHMMHMRATCA